jgi:hypothetical protein
MLAEWEPGVTKECLAIQAGLSLLLLASKSLEMLFGPLAQRSKRGYRFSPAQKTLKAKVGGLARWAIGRLLEVTIARTN